MKGTELIGQLRNLGVTAKLVIKSANDNTADVARFKQAGADGVIAKGLTPEAFGRELIRILGNDAAARFDSTVLADQKEEDRHRMVRGFRKAAPIAVVAAEAACRDGRAEVVLCHVHRLKGHACCVGATELIRAAGAMRKLPVEQYHNALVRVRLALDEALAVLANMPGVPQDVGTSSDAQAQPLALSVPPPPTTVGSAGHHYYSDPPLLDRAHAAAQGAAVLTAFDACSRVLLNELRTAVAAPGASCRQLLHRLRGACKLVGAHRLALCTTAGEKSVDAFSATALTVLEALHAETLAELESRMHTLPQRRTVTGS
jgi:CheY-like chemotaxis protein